MEVVLCQLDIRWEDKRANYDRVERLLEDAPPARGDLVAVPEMFATGFSMNVEAIAEGPSVDTECFLARVAARYGACVIGGLVTAGPDGKGRNEAVALDPKGRCIARYSKMHPFSFGGETRYYARGERPALFSWGETTIAPFICYDLRFPEVFRSAVQQGAELFVVIANWPQPREAHWITLLKARAIENQAYVVGVNRCGRDPKLGYSGRSMVVDPRGEVMADAGGEEGIIRAALDLPALRAYRAQFPALEDIHPEYVRAG